MLQAGQDVEPHAAHTVSLSKLWAALSNETRLQLGRLQMWDKRPKDRRCNDCVKEFDRIVQKQLDKSLGVG